jgi:hypothetical protein
VRDVKGRRGNRLWDEREETSASVSLRSVRRKCVAWKAQRDPPITRNSTAQDGSSR